MISNIKTKLSIRLHFLCSSKFKKFISSNNQHKSTKNNYIRKLKQKNVILLF